LIDSLEIQNKKSVESLIGFNTTYKSLNITNEKVKSGEAIIHSVISSVSLGDDLFSTQEFNRIKTILDYINKNINSEIRKNHINDIKKYKKIIDFWVLLCFNGIQKGD
jgi:hypothetical protein